MEEEGGRGRKTHRWLLERMSVLSDDLDSLRVRKPEIQSSRKRAECGKTGASVLFVGCVDVASIVKYIWTSTGIDGSGRERGRTGRKAGYVRVNLE